MAGETSFQTQYATDGVSGGAPAFATGELEQGIRPTGWGKWVEQVKQTSLDSPLGFMPGFEGAWSRGMVQNAMERELKRKNSGKISPEDANTRYPGMPVPFNEPVYPEVAELMYSDQQRRKKLQDWVDRGPETGALFSFSAAATTALDPVNLSLNIAGGAALRAMGVPMGAAATFAENLAGNLAADVPSYFQLKRERQDVAVTDVLYSSTAGAALGTGIAKALEGIGRITSRGSKQADEVSIKSAVRQHEVGARTDVTPTVMTGAMRDAGITRSGTVENPYVYREVTHPSERFYYSARDPDTNQKVNFGRNYGEGTHAVDDGVVANGHAGNPESKFDGQIDQVRVPEDAKFLDIGKTLQDPESAAFVKAVESKLNRKFEAPADSPVEKVLDQINLDIRSGELPESAMSDVVGVAQSLGYDGYRYVNDIDGIKNNGLMVFDDSKVSIQSTYTANKDLAPSVSEQMSYVDPKDSELSSSQRVYSPERQVEIESMKSAKLQTEEDLDPVLKAQEEQARALLKEASETDPELAEELEGLRRAEAQDKQEAQAFRDYANCILNNIT